MDTRSADLLEFPLIRERLAAYAAFAPSQRLAAAVEPAVDPIIVTRRLDETDEARWLQQEHPQVGVGGARDIAPVLARASRGGRLDPPELWAGSRAAKTHFAEALGMMLPGCAAIPAPMQMPKKSSTA